MKVTIDRHRIIHLCVLVGMTVLGGQWLIRQWEWPPLSAYGCSCTLVTQLSHAIGIVWRTQQTQDDEGHHATAAKQQHRGNPKKKKQRQQHKTKGKLA